MTLKKTKIGLRLLLLVGALLFLVPLIAERFSLVTKNEAFVMFHVGLSVLVMAAFIAAYRKLVKCKK